MLESFVIPFILLIIGLTIEYHSGLFAQGSTLRQKIINLINHIPFKKTAIILSVLVLTSVAFLTFIMPSSTSISWIPSKNISNNNENASEAGNNRLILRQSSEETFVTSKLLSNDTFPTDVSIRLTDKSRKIYAGTYGAGVYIYRENRSWQSIGLRGTVITTILTDQTSESVLAATNTGIYITQDDGKTWEQRGPIDGLVSQVVHDPNRGNVLIAGTVHGIFRSTDLGKTWLGPSYESESIASIIIAPSDPSRVYFTTYSGLLYRSYDNGANWDLVYKSPTQDIIIVQVDPLDSNTLYLGTNKSGLLKSTDSGITWNNLGLPDISITSIFIPTSAPNIIYVGATNLAGMYVSENGGHSWQNWGVLSDNVLSFAEDKSEPGTIIVTAKNRGLLKTRDEGQTWMEMGLDRPRLVPSFEIANIVELSDKSGHFLARAYDTGLIESFDGGVSWSPVSSNVNLMGQTIRDIQTDSKNTKKVYISLQGGAIYFSPDAGLSWRSITNNLPIEGYAPVAIADNIIYAGASNQGVWKKEESSDLWQRTGMARGAFVKLKVDASKNAHVYALKESGILYKSIDSGLTWTDIYSNVRDFALDPIKPDLVSVTTESAIDVSIDGGSTWKEVRNFEPIDLQFGPKVTTV